MKEFFTRQAANEGVKLPLYLPDGTASDHWLLIRGVDSDDFREAETHAKRKALEISAEKDAKKRDAMIRDAELSCISALISDWSFDEECTTESKLTFLREAPQISDKVNQFAASRGNFYRKK